MGQMQAGTFVLALPLVPLGNSLHPTVPTIILHPARPPSSLNNGTPTDIPRTIYHIWCCTVVFCAEPRYSYQILTVKWSSRNSLRPNKHHPSIFREIGSSILCIQYLGKDSTVRLACYIAQHAISVSQQSLENFLQYIVGWACSCMGPSTLMQVPLHICD
jgi:hypothetical protein